MRRNIELLTLVAFLISKTSSDPYQTLKTLCTTYAKPCTKTVNPLIVGGSEAGEKEFPHMALIGFGEGDELQWECGGALISDTFVLSAAHCGDSREFGPAKKAKMGLVHRDEQGGHVQERNIVRAIIHPAYKRPIKYHDIALFQLETAIEFTDFVWPACVNTDQSWHALKPSAIGFGKTKFTNEKGHERLKKVFLPVLANSECQQFYASMKVSTLNQGLIDSQICAGILKGGHDTCQGDSGGPFQVFIEEPLCNYNVIGVTSFGKFCGYAKSPAIYTNVYHYVPWIVESVWDK